MKILKYGKINDMPRGWKREEVWRLYACQMWYNMWERVYTHLNYFGCQICHDYRYLSKYIEDIQRLENFDLFKETCEDFSWSIDKDIKIKGNRDYYFEALSLVTRNDNTKYTINERGNKHLLKVDRVEVGRKTRKPIIGISTLNGSVVLFKYLTESELRNFKSTCISNCLNKRQKTHKGYKWLYVNYKHNKLFRKV